MLINHCLANQSPEKLPPASERNKYTDPQREITLRGKVLGIYSLNVKSAQNFFPQDLGNLVGADI